MTQVNENVNQDVKPNQSKRGRPIDRHSSISKAREIFASLPVTGNSRKDSVKAFMEIKNLDGVNISKQTAGAYYAVITRGQTRTV